ncbi:unnamed protein product, partial [Prorocentrum cordatum]
PPPKGEGGAPPSAAAAMPRARTPREARQEEGSVRTTRVATSSKCVSKVDLLPAILKPLPEDYLDSHDDVFEDRGHPLRVRERAQATQGPGDLWDSEDATLLELAKCRAFVRVVDLDPKKGTYRLRTMKCMWVFRTLNSREEAEIALRGVPGVRMPGLVVTVEESRIWKDMSCDYSSAATTSKTLCWRGITLMSLDGFKSFNMADFPYDRHTLQLERMEFVWRTHKDDDDYFKAMRLVSFEVRTSSMLPEWQAFPPYIRQLNETLVDGGRAGNQRAPTYASKFTVHLRLQRKHHFYLWQVFLVSYLIVLLSVSPLSMPPNPDTLAERIGLYSAGMLTLVAFKYGVSDHLPCVPYLTYADYFLLGGVVTIFVCSVASLYPWRFAGESEWKKWILDVVENITGLCILLAWTVALLYTWFKKPQKRVHWRNVLAQDLENMDPFGREEREDLDREEGANNERSGVWGKLLDTGGGLSKRGYLFGGPSPTRAVAAPEREVPQAPVEEWTVRQVAVFISGLGLGHCLHHFRENAVDGRMLDGLGQRDLERELGLRPLQAKKVLAELSRLKAARGTGKSTPNAA